MPYSVDAKQANFSSLHALAANSFLQKIIARLVLNLFKSRDTIVVLQRYIPHFLFSTHEYF